MAYKAQIIIFERAKMLVYGVAVIRSGFVQNPIDFRALFAIWVAVSASHSLDAYWAAVTSVALLVEFLYPPSLAVTGTTVVLAHSAVYASFSAKHIGAILISLASLTQVKNRKWILEKAKGL